jgi:hypothetical protein
MYAVPIFSQDIEILTVSDQGANQKLAVKIIQISTLGVKQMTKDNYCCADDIDFQYLPFTWFQEKLKSHKKDWRGIQVTGEALLDKLYVSQLEERMHKMVCEIPDTISNYKRDEGINLIAPELTKIRVIMLLRFPRARINDGEN